MSILCNFAVKLNKQHNEFESNVYFQVGSNCRNRRFGCRVRNGMEIPL